MAGAGLRKEFVTGDFKIVTETSVTIKKYVGDCDGPVKIRHNMKQFVTDCDWPVTIPDTVFFSPNDIVKAEQFKSQRFTVFFEALHHHRLAKLPNTPTKCPVFTI